MGFDYVGAHRNQYDDVTWFRCVETNRRLPKKYQIALRYPHLPTMLETDPSEAVHAELQLPVLRRHFDIQEMVNLGGGVAYTLLYQNRPLFDDQNTEDGRNAISYIMQEDKRLLSDHPPSNLFSFFVAKAKAERPTDIMRAGWQVEEDRRETLSISNEGRYYPPTPLETIYNGFYCEVDSLRQAIPL